MIKFVLKQNSPGACILPYRNSDFDLTLPLSMEPDFHTIMELTFEIDCFEIALLFILTMSVKGIVTGIIQEYNNESFATRKWCRLCQPKKSRQSVPYKHSEVFLLPTKLTFAHLLLMQEHRGWKQIFKHREQIPQF